MVLLRPSCACWEAGHLGGRAYEATAGKSPVHPCLTAYCGIAGITLHNRDLPPPPRPPEVMAVACAPSIECSGERARRARGVMTIYSPITTGSMPTPTGQPQVRYAARSPGQSDASCPSAQLLCRLHQE